MSRAQSQVAALQKSSCHSGGQRCGGSRLHLIRSHKTRLILIIRIGCVYTTRRHRAALPYMRRCVPGHLTETSPVFALVRAAQVSKCFFISQSEPTNVRSNNCILWKWVLEFCPRDCKKNYWAHIPVCYCRDGAILRPWLLLLSPIFNIFLVVGISSFLIQRR